MAVPFCVVARLLGAKLIFVETMARIDSASASGRVLSRLATRVLVQWPEMARVYPGATVCRPLLLEGVVGGESSGGRGTFAGVGTHNAPFDRLIRAVEAASAGRLIPQPVLIQTGVSMHRPVDVSFQPFLEPDELEAAVAEHACIICHCGSGILASALRSGTRPIVMPRRGDNGEHVDDHQVRVAEALERMDLAVVVEDQITSEHVRAASRQLVVPESAFDLPRVQDVLTAALDELNEAAA
jgi:UDP-N-acetylglucosamine--N-acetylmuramyl-(pentapeptide) pyrophosphoryl-undecaprenol N-acetylglucosamine transferase